MKNGQAVLAVRHWQEDGCDVLQPESAIYRDNIENLRELINQLASKKKKHIILDLQFVDMIDSSGLGLMLNALSRIKEYNGNLLLCGVSPYLKKILGLIILPMEENLNKALVAVKLEEEKNA